MKIRLCNKKSHYLDFPVFIRSHGYGDFITDVEQLGLINYECHTRHRDKFPYCKSPLVLPGCIIENESDRF